MLYDAPGMRTGDAPGMRTGDAPGMRAIPLTAAYIRL